MRTLTALFILLAAPVFALRADLNSDGRVDIADLAILASEWMQEGATTMEAVLPEPGHVKAGVVYGAKGLTKEPQFEPAWMAGSVNVNEVRYLQITAAPMEEPWGDYEKQGSARVEVEFASPHEHLSGIYEFGPVPSYPTALVLWLVVDPGFLGEVVKTTYWQTYNEGLAIEPAEEDVRDGVSYGDPAAPKIGTMISEPADGSAGGAKSVFGTRKSVY